MNTEPTGAPPSGAGTPPDDENVRVIVAGRLTCEKCKRKFLVFPEDLWAVNACPFCLTRFGVAESAYVQ